METLKFKTNLKCSGCVAAVKNSLDAVKNVNSWEVDLVSPDKTLTVEGSADEDDIVAAFAKAGYQADPLK
jgi:copper chaperone